MLDRGERVSDSIDKDILRGMLSTLLLQLIAEEPAHGYGLCERLRERSGGVITIKESSVYTALYRLEREGLIVAERSKRANGRTTKIYTISDQGRAELQAGISRWERFHRAVGEFFETRLASGRVPECA